MKFFDEARIEVTAGNGGSGASSFRREKFVPFGGPDGGDGGRGGSVIAVADHNINTLIDYRYARKHLAKHGERGRGSDQNGAASADVFLRVPVGTSIYELVAQDDAHSDLDDDSSNDGEGEGDDDPLEKNSKRNKPMLRQEGRLLADLTEHGEQFVVAKGGDGGLGNINFKSSTNRAPRKFTPGRPGEHRALRLELKVMADVGLLGMPNAGKSTLVTALSNARPKIADYPFTTLTPSLGVVRVGPEKSFVIADIPGLIEGASEGAGLGHQFLRHLQRTSLLLHIVDLAPMDEGTDPAVEARAIVGELKKYDEALFHKPRWLVLNKLDMVAPDERAAKVADFVKRFAGRGRGAIPVDKSKIFQISGLTREGCEGLMLAAYDYLEGERKLVQARAETAKDVRFVGTGEHE